MQIPMRSTIGLTVGLVFAACGEPMQPQPEEPRPEEFPPAGTPVALTLVSGDQQEGKAGEALSERFVVRVTDVAGDPVEDCDVEWFVTAGAGVLIDERRWGAASTRTNSDGIAMVTLLPTALGTVTVDARAVGLGTLRSKFTARTTALVIHNLYWGIVLGPGGSTPHVSVPVGTPVEWVNYGTAARIRSTRAPTGGGSFDSGILFDGERIRFVPDVQGQWEWTWEYPESPEESMVTNAILTVQ
jgi:hypothetical protein